MHYCEFYSPLDCCRTIPCTRRGSARIVFQKNHDFDLSLDPHLPHCLYLVQTREPLLEAMSDRELAESVRPELKGDLDELVVWLGKKISYYRHFFQKWINGASAQCIHIPYRSLVEDPLGVLNLIFDRTGLVVDSQTVLSAIASQSGKRDAGQIFAPRKAIHVSVQRPYFDCFASFVADLETGAEHHSFNHLESGVGGAMRLAAEAHGTAMDHDLASASSKWQEFCRRYPNNPHGLVEYSCCLQALGDSREALRWALRAARQTPLRMAAIKRGRDLLNQQGHFRLARKLSALMVDRFPNRPLTLIDYAVDLFHAGDVSEAGAVARRFVEEARAFPLSWEEPYQLGYLRAYAFGFNVALFWDVAGNILKSGGETRLGLDAAAIARAMSG